MWTIYKHNLPSASCSCGSLLAQAGNHTRYILSQCLLVVLAKVCCVYLHLRWLNLNSNWSDPFRIPIVGFYFTSFVASNPHFHCFIPWHQTPNSPVLHSSPTASGLSALRWTLRKASIRRWWPLSPCWPFPQWSVSWRPWLARCNTRGWKSNWDNNGMMGIGSYHFQSWFQMVKKQSFGDDVLEFDWICARDDPEWWFRWKIDGSKQVGLAWVDCFQNIVVDWGKTHQNPGIKDEQFKKRAPVK